MPSFTEIMPTTFPFLEGNSGSHKRKRNGNAEGSFFSSQGQDPNITCKPPFPSSNTHLIPSGQESAAQRTNAEAANLPIYQVYGNWVAGENAIHKRRRCSDVATEDLDLYQDAYEAPNTYAGGSDCPRLIARPHNRRTSSAPYTSNYTEGARDRNEPTHQHTVMNSLEQLQLQAKLHLPCHICHKRARYKDELERFTFCQECGERTCNICLRICFNGLVDETAVTGTGIDTSRFEMEYPNGNPYASNENREHDEAGSAQFGRTKHRHKHKERICSSCCVEKGEDGEVFCLGCVEECV